MFEFKQRRGQGFLLFIMVMLFSMSFILYAINNGNGTYSSGFFRMIGANNETDLQNATSGTTGYFLTLKDQFLVTMGVGALGGLVTAFSLGFPNYVAMFLGLAIGILGFLSVPVGILNAESSFPLALRAFIAFLMQMLIVMGVIGWLKGNTP